MLFAPLFGCGVWLLRPQEALRGSGYSRRILDLGLVASAAALIVIFLFYPYFVNQEEPTLYFAASISYPVLYLSVAIFTFYRAWSFIWGSKAFVFALLLLGFFVHAVTDTVYAYALLGKNYQVGNYIDVAWLIGFALISLAAIDVAGEPHASSSSDTTNNTIRFTGQRVYEPLISLITAIVVVATYLSVADTIDIRAAPVVFPLVLLFLLLTALKEIRSRQAELELLRKTEIFSARLAANEQKMREIGETSYDRIWESDENHRFTMVMGDRDIKLSPTTDVALGKTRWEVCGVDPIHFQRWRQHVDDLQAHRRFRDFEYSVTTPTGGIESWSVSGKPRFDQNGTFIGYIGSSRNISENKRLKERADVASKRLEEIISIAPEAVIIVRANMRIQLFNLGAQRIFGYEPSEIIDKPIETLMPARFRKAHGMAVKNFCDSNDTYRLMDARQEIIGLRKNGTEFPAAASVSRNVFEGETYFTVMLQDTTERRAAEAARLKALKEAEKANKAKSEFMASMSHELRTPLNSILGFSEMIANQYLGPIGVERYSKYAEDISFSGRHLLELVNQILDIERIEAGKYQLEMELIAVPDLLCECSRLLEKRAEDAGILLNFVVVEDTLSLHADRRALLQILINLITNAIKFTSEKGSVDVKAYRHGENVMIEVSDTGIGIPDSKIDVVLEPFARHESNPHEPQEGVGLGLAISNALVKLHNGQLEIRSELGVGTTATIKIPANPKQQT